jgi:hypothetical protein
MSTPLVFKDPNFRASQTAYLEFSAKNGSSDRADRADPGGTEGRSDPPLKAA